MAAAKHYKGFFQIHGIFTYDEEGKKTDKIPYNVLSYSISNQQKHFNVDDHSKYATLHNVTITRDADAASSQLQISTKKAELGDCVIDSSRVGEESNPFVTFTLKNAQILDINYLLDNNAGKFQEVISIIYNAIDFAYIPLTYDNDKRPKHTFSHSSEEEK